jgi:hypothetical protein
MAVRDSLIIVVWDDGFTPRPAIKMRTSPNAGGRFGPVTLVSDADQVAAFPVVSFVTGGVRVMWAQDTPAGHDHAAVTAPDMRDPKAVKGLTPVGTGQVVARELIVR